MVKIINPHQKAKRYVKYVPVLVTKLFGSSQIENIPTEHKIKRSFEYLQTHIENLENIKLDVNIQYPLFKERLESYLEKYKAGTLEQEEFEGKTLNYIESVVVNIVRGALAKELFERLDKGAVCKWMPSISKNKRHSHILLYGKKFNCKEGIDGLHPGDEINCRCGARVLNTEKPP